MSYRRELEKYRDLDEDEILGALTEEELRTLENELDELDPDVSGTKGEHVVAGEGTVTIATWGGTGPGFLQPTLPLSFRGSATGMTLPLQVCVHVRVCVWCQHTL